MLGTIFLLINEFLNSVTSPSIKDSVECIIVLSLPLILSLFFVELKVLIGKLNISKLYLKLSLYKAFIPALAPLDCGYILGSYVAGLLLASFLAL